MVAGDRYMPTIRQLHHKGKGALKSDLMNQMSIRSVANPDGAGVDIIAEIVITAISRGLDEVFSTQIEEVAIAREGYCCQVAGMLQGIENVRGRGVPYSRTTRPGDSQPLPIGCEGQIIDPAVGSLDRAGRQTSGSVVVWPGRLDRRLDCSGLLATAEAAQPQSQSRDKNRL